MKTYSLTDKLPDRTPMTPPDDPPEPRLDDALPCPICGYTPEWEAKPNSRELRVYCQQHLSSTWEDNINDAIAGWNTLVEDFGAQLKAAGQSKVAEHNEEWMERVLEMIRRFAKSGTEFTSEDLRNYCGTWADFPAPKSPNGWGAAFSVAAKQGLIARVGYAKNKLASAHARVVAVWKGKS